MENNRINFLDTTIIKEEIHLEQFRKPEASGVVLNYKTANCTEPITPLLTKKPGKKHFMKPKKFS